jgi:hypothetical protein
MLLAELKLGKDSSLGLFLKVGCQKLAIVP